MNDDQKKELERLRGESSLRGHWISERHFQFASEHLVIPPSSLAVVLDGSLVHSGMNNEEYLMQRDARMRSLTSTNAWRSFFFMSSFHGEEEQYQHTDFGLDDDDNPGNDMDEESPLPNQREVRDENYSNSEVMVLEEVD
jgi:hypothetical protein